MNNQQTTNIVEEMNPVVICNDNGRMFFDHDTKKFSTNLTPTCLLPTDDLASTLIALNKPFNEEFHNAFVIPALVVVEDGEMQITIIVD
ncbi:hypothetical protein [Tumebacillus flagellatus]|uniref:Uncharacterized protein n=1 Tax=Tumebacillus flagellatus TaxID=1157490 RepID=A0A074LI86_9BACL|nr:hypothetical protein [Tumebacillus flagellatus]KEO80854.1 hypothetical protein EL26_24040 [Tumebacillus flagellatus]